MVGAWSGTPVEHGAPRGKVQTGGDGGEGGPASRSGAAPRGVQVRAGGEGGAGRAPRSPAGPGACSRRGEQGGAPAARAGPRRPGPSGGLIPICLVCGEERAGAGAPCAPPQHLDCIYQRVVSLEASTTPSSITQSGQVGLPRENKSVIPPPLLPSLGSGPLLCGLPGCSNPRTPARSAPTGPARGRSGPGCAPRNHRGALAVRRAPHPTITLRICPGRRGVVVSMAAGPGARATRARRSRRPGSLRPPPSALPHPTDRPVPTAAVAACSNPRSVGPAPGRPPSPRPTAAFAARLNLRSVGLAPGRGARPRPFPPSPPV